MTEQELILTSVLKCRRVDLYTTPRTLSGLQREAIAEIESRREVHEPLQYILQTSEFMGLDFFVDERVLIPRPETELLVEQVEKVMGQQTKKNLRILDIGTGSGNIIVSLAKRNPGHAFYALDRSSDALKVATTNAAKHDVLGAIQFLQADISFDHNFCPYDEKFDIIISNPPYIKTDDIDSLSSEVQQEPRMALDGGVDGLFFYRQIARRAKDLLSSDGVLCLEIGQGQAEDVKNILGNVGQMIVCECISDYLNIQRIMIAKRT